MRSPGDAWRAHNPVEIIFGAGSITEMPRLLVGQSVLLLTTAGATQRGLTRRITDLMGGRRVTVHDRVTTNVELDQLESAAVILAPGAFDEIVAVGGGSAIDAAKVLSYLLLGPNPGALRNYLERAVPLPVNATPIPVMAVPTTSGTGAEVTPFATVWDRRRSVKHSFTFGEPFPRVALLDPELTISMPSSLTLTTGLDALCQGLESLWSVRSNPLSATYARRAVQVSLEALPAVMRHPDDLPLRTAMMEASLLAGMAISISKTTLPHSISYPLTLRYDVPHGLACGFTIAQVLRFNAEHDRARIDRISEEVGAESADVLVGRLCDLLAGTGAYGRLSALIPSDTAVASLAQDAITPGRADNNPRPASVSEIECILDDAFEVVHDRPSQIKHQQQAVR